jgi:hypothetical protein
MACLMITVGTAGAQTASMKGALRIRIDVGGQVLTATLADNPTTRDLMSQLPLVLTAKDFMATEKVAYPPRKLSVDAAPASYTPVEGDLCYYGPWGNLALFYASGKPSPGLVLLGRFDGPVDALRKQGEIAVRIERAR